MNVTMLRIDEEDLVDSARLTENEQTNQPPRAATPRTEIAPVLSLPPPPPPLPPPEVERSPHRPSTITDSETQIVNSQIQPDQIYTEEHSPETGIRQTHVELQTILENDVGLSVNNRMPPRDPRERRPHPVHPAAFQNGNHFCHRNGVSHLVSHYENQHHPYGHHTSVQRPYIQPQGYMHPGNRAYPYYAGNHGSGLSKSANRNGKSKVKSVDTSCIVQILIGLCTTSNAVVMVIYQLWHIGAGFWCSAFFIASGIVGILSNLTESRKLRRWNIALCLLNLCFFYIALVVSDIVGLVFDLKHAKNGDLETLIICLHSINVIFSAIGMTSAILQITPKTYAHNPYSSQSIHDADSKETAVSSMLSSSKTSKQKYPHFDKDAARLLAPPASPNSQLTGSTNSYPFRPINGCLPNSPPQLGPVPSPNHLGRVPSPPHQIGPLPNPILMRPPGSPQVGRISPSYPGSTASPSHSSRGPSPMMGGVQSPVQQTKVPHPYSVPGRSPSPSMKYSRVPSPAGSRRTHSTSGSSKASTCTVRYQKPEGSTPPPPYSDECHIITFESSGAHSPVTKLRYPRELRLEV